MTTFALSTSSNGKNQRNSFNFRLLGGRLPRYWRKTFLVCALTSRKCRFCVQRDCARTFPTLVDFHSLIDEHGSANHDSIFANNFNDIVVACLQNVHGFSLGARGIKWLGKNKIPTPETPIDTDYTSMVRYFCWACNFVCCASYSFTTMAFCKYYLLTYLLITGKLLELSSE